MEKHSESEWRAFWQNLMEGYDSFEKSKQPPDVLVQDKKYVFDEATD